MPLTDDNGKEKETLDIDKPYIYSMHGSCSIISKEELATKYFGTTDVDKIRKEYIRHDCRKILLKAKEYDTKIDIKAPSKARCPFAISYWLYWMNIGDVVFVRKSSGIVYICKIFSDCEFGNDCNNYIHPKRYVEVLNKFTYEELTKKLVCGKNRLDSQKTLQRVSNYKDKKELTDFLLSIYKA